MGKQAPNGEQLGYLNRRQVGTGDMNMKSTLGGYLAVPQAQALDGE
jgi:hypothetical protein